MKNQPNNTAQTYYPSFERDFSFRPFGTFAFHRKRFYLGLMTPYQFRLPSIDDQALAVWQGEYFLSKEEAGCTVMLYKVHHFYVEVYFNTEENEIVRFNPFRLKKRL